MKLLRKLLKYKLLYNFSPLFALSFRLTRVLYFSDRYSYLVDRKFL